MPHIFKHSVSPSGKAQVESACWNDAEAPARSDASASCYCGLENVGILAVVETPLKFVQVQWQIFFAHLVVRSDYAALQERPERFEVLGMHLGAHVLTLHMV